MTLESCYSVEAFFGIEGLENIRDRWEALFARCCNAAFYNDWRWHYAIQKHLAREDIAYLVVTAPAGDVALVPLQRWVQRYGPVAVRMLGFPRHVALDLSDMIVAQSHQDCLFVDALIAYLKKQSPWAWDELRLERFTERSACARQMILSRAGVETIGHSAFVRSDAGGLIGGLAKKQIKNVRRHWRNAEQQFGPGTLHSASGMELDDAYKAFLAVEASGWKGDHGAMTAIALRPDARSFYDDVLRRFATTGQAVVNLSRLGAATVAGQIGLRSGSCLSLLKIGFDEQFRDVGPGGIALLQALEAEDGRVTEFGLVTCPAWADRWHFASERVLRVSIANDGWYARLLRRGIAVARSMSKTARRLRRNGANAIA